MSWCEQRLQQLPAGVSESRGARVIFHEICQLDFAGMSQPQRIASLLGIAQHVAVIEGLDETLIRLASQTDEGTGAATFLDAPKSFTRPAVLLDSRFFEADVELDVYVGLVLHEFAHLKFTRRFFLEAGNLPRYQRMLCNLIEDYRIERLMGGSSAAWQTYLERTRRRLVEEDGISRALAEWPDLSELNRLTLLLALLLFMPEVLVAREDLRTWRTADGTCACEELAAIFAAEPQSEDDVFHAAAEMVRRFPACQAANGELGLKEDIQLWEEAFEQPGWHWFTLSEQLKTREQIRQPLELDLINQVWKELEQKESRFDEMPESDWRREDASTRSRLSVLEVEAAGSDEAAATYASIARECRSVSAELRQLFADPVSNLSGRVSGQWAGRIDPRRLYRHGFDPRLFQQPVTHRQRLMPTTVGLLLDGSGSMRGLAEQLALRLGVILCESFQESRHVEVRIFSHVGAETHCELRDYGDKQTAARRLGGFRAEQMANYDDLAMGRVAELLEQRPTGRRVLFVLSDARPTHRFTARSQERYAMSLTRAEVMRLRGRGWRLIGLTVGSGAGDFIYGRDRVHLSHPGDIPTKFAPLLKGLFGV